MLVAAFSIRDNSGKSNSAAASRIYMLNRPAAFIFHSAPVIAATWSVPETGLLPEPVLRMFPRESVTTKRLDLSLCGVYDLIAVGLRMIGSGSGCHSCKSFCMASNVLFNIRTES